MSFKIQGASIFACAALCISFGASRADAQSIGYVSTFDGNVSPVESYNSAGGTNSLAFIGTTMQVTLPGLGNGLNSNVQVGAVNSKGRAHYCTVINWGSSNGVDVIVNVACFDLSNTPVLADFAMFYQARTTRPVGADVAFVWANQPSAAHYRPDPTYSFNSIGGINRINRSSAGNYTVILGDFQATDTNVQVTAYGNTAARCQIVNWMKSFPNAHVQVHCVNAGNTPTDELFSLSYVLGGVAGSGHAAGAFAWANNPTAKTYTPNRTFQFSNISQAQPLIGTRFGGLLQGQYSLEIPNPGQLTFATVIGMVTAYGSNGEYCDTAGISDLGNEFDLDITCFNAGGVPINTRYSATFMGTH